MSKLTENEKLQIGNALLIAAEIYLRDAIDMRNAPNSLIDRMELVKDLHTKASECLRLVRRVEEL